MGLFNEGSLSRGELLGVFLPPTYRGFTIVVVAGVSIQIYKYNVRAWVPTCMRVVDSCIRRAARLQSVPGCSWVPALRCLGANLMCGLSHDMGDTILCLMANMCSVNTGYEDHHPAKGDILVVGLL
jgi:hypothetical protein